MSHREKPECVMEGTTFAKTEKSSRDQIKSLFKNSRMCLTDPLKQTQVLYEASRVALVSYKLELARGICPLPLQRLVLCWCSCWPSKCPESSSRWRVRHSVLQGNWGNRPLDRYFQNWFFDPNLCISSYLEKHLIPSWWHQFSSVTQPCLMLCDPMNHSIPGRPVHHQLPEFTQTHVHRVGDTIQLSHPLSSPSPPAPNPSQHQDLFKWVNSSHQVAKVLDFLQLQHQSFQWTPRTDLL